MIALCAAILSVFALNLTLLPAQELRDPDGTRIAGLHSTAQQKALRLWLLHPPEDEANFLETIFYHEAQLRPALRALVRDQKVGNLVVEFLSLIGEPPDLGYLIEHPPYYKREAFPDRWAYGVASSLLDAGTDKEWSFLRQCALNKFDDRWVDEGAIQTLKLIASPKSEAILQDVRSSNPSRAHLVGNALEYVRSSPPPLVATNLGGLAARVAKIIRIGSWEGNGEPRYNKAADKALVNLTFVSGQDLLIYTATFYKSGDTWRLHGVRETAQAFMLPSLPLKAPTAKGPQAQ